MIDGNLQEEVAELRRRLEEAEEVIRAIHTGAVDAFVVAEPEGNRIYTLESADRPYRLLVEQMQQGAVTLNKDGAIAYCNLRFADLLGRPHGRLMGMSFGDFIAPSDGGLYGKLLEQGQTSAGQGEAQMQRADGSLIPVFLTLNALPADCGAAVGVLVTDLTTQRHQEKLGVAVEALREADRRKNEFLAMLAHELRNPLAPIRNALQIIKVRGGDGEAMTSASAMMERQVGQMVRLVDDLLDVSRINRDKIELRRETVLLGSVVGEAVEAARSLWQQSNRELTVEIDPVAIYLNADPTRLAQVVGNLLNNANKFTDLGGRIWLTVARERASATALHEGDGGTAVVSVRDNGIGIAADKMSCIFDMFTQIDTSLERSVSGLGIGLALVKKLVEMHGGTVEVRSGGAGAGSEFIVRLPMAVRGAGEKDAAVNPTMEAAGLKLKRVLVVDDNRDSADSLAMVLQLKGFETRTAYDGPEAFEVAKTFLPDVVLLDIGLPRMNGFDTCRKIRGETWGKGLVLIALTGWGQADDRRKSQEAGFDGHLVKPVEHETLMQLMAKLLPAPA